jgi:hypothetical protein
MVAEISWEQCAWFSHNKKTTRAQFRIHICLFCDVLDGETLAKLSLVPGTKKNRTTQDKYRTFSLIDLNDKLE